MKKETTIPRDLLKSDKVLINRLNRYEREIRVRKISK